MMYWLNLSVMRLADSEKPAWSPVVPTLKLESHSVM